jgi:hypothetical protein
MQMAQGYPRLFRLATLTVCACSVARFGREVGVLIEYLASLCLAKGMLAFIQTSQRLP